jgi:prohibitin 1
MVSITLRVLSRPDVKHLPKIYQNLGLDYDERVLPSIGNEVLKSIVAQFDAAELITQREVVCSFDFAWQESFQMISLSGVFSY